jgi:hypothetical protein
MTASDITAEIERKHEAAMERRRRRAIAGIKAAVQEEIARYNERLREETKRHMEAMTDYERELQTYKNQMNKGGEQHD